MRAPDLVSSFEYHGRTIKVDWFDYVSSDELDDIKWQQVYAIGDVNGKVPIVHYPEPDHKDNLPGGHVEANETIDQALRREMVEELNMRVLSWELLGFQRLTEPSGEVVYQLRVYAKLEAIGPFERDPGGNVIGHSLVGINKVNSFIQYGEEGDRLIDLARPKFYPLSE